MKYEIECPLGGKCEHTKDNKNYRCAWYTKLVGKDPQSNKEIDEWKCAMAWMPLMMVENAQMVRSNRMVMEEVRDESKVFNGILKNATKQIK